MAVQSALPLPDANADRPVPPIDVTPSEVVTCDDVDEGVDRYGELGYTLLAIGPADDPRWALLGDGRNPSARPVRLERRRSTATAPTASAEANPADDWVVGRAGMRYRDLVPDRWGGQFIASHIHIPDGGPVPDYVHYHHVDFQLIFCYRGWVRVVYQDQGGAFRLEPGDAILQAPGIRHRVLEASDDLQVIEVSSPAEHTTFVEHDLTLPNGLATGRRYGGQAYVHHRFRAARWHEGNGGVRRQSFELEAATSGRYGASIIELHGDHRSVLGLPVESDVDFELIVVLDGELMVTDDADDGEPVTKGPGAALALDDTRSLSAWTREQARLLTVSRHRA